ncbi:unnamed protein product, partial [Symbiodinium sp. CCMP2456]
MSTEEREVYQTYVDTKQLSRLMWLESTATDQVPSFVLPAFDALKALLGRLYLRQPIMFACGEGRRAIACPVKIKAAGIRKVREQGHVGRMADAGRSTTASTSHMQPGRKRWMLCSYCAKACEAPMSELSDMQNQVHIATSDSRSGDRLCSRHVGRAEMLQKFMQRAFAVASGPADEGQRDRKSGIKLAEPPTGDRPWHKWLQVERPAADENV